MSKKEADPRSEQTVKASLLRTSEDEGLTVDRFMPRIDTPGRVGVTLSGGGSRAMSAALGQLRGLANVWPEESSGKGAPLLGRTKALSAVSGGSWLSGPFMFLPGHISDEEYLGTYVPDPGRLVPRRRLRRTAAEELDQMAPAYAGQSVGSPRFTVVGLALQAILLRRVAKVPMHRLWQTMIGLNILKPFGLYQRGETFEPTSTFSFDAETRDRDIRRNNPDLADYPVHLVAAGADRIRRPFWICNASMFVNEPEAQGQDLVPVHSTPFFTGILSRPDAVDRNGLRVGGGAVTSFAFSSQPAEVEGDTVRVSQRLPFALSDTVGLSSVAFATGLEQQMDEWRQDHTALVGALLGESDNLTGWAEEHFDGEVPKLVEGLLHRPSLVNFLEKSGLGAKLDSELVAAVEEINDFIPEERYWPVRQPGLQRSTELEVRATRFADGGNLENTGIANLLTYRDVDRIIAFVNSSTSMKQVEVGVLAPADAEGRSVEVPDTRILVDSQVPVLFGYRAHAEGLGYRLYAEAEPDTLPAEEKPFGEVKVFAPEAFPDTLRGLWAASHGLRRPAVFSQDLTTVENKVFGVPEGREVRVLWCYLDRVEDWLDLLTDDVRGLLDKKGFESFPSFPTNQGLNPTQINLMAHLTSWCVADPSNREAFRAMYR